MGVRILNASPEKHLFRSLLTKQGTPSGVLFALAGALVICRGGVSPPVYNGWIFGRGDPSPTEGAERATFRRRRIPCAANGGSIFANKCAAALQMRTVEDACPYRFCVHFPAVIYCKSLAISPILCYTNPRKAVGIWKWFYMNLALTI